MSPRWRSLSPCRPRRPQRWSGSRWSTVIMPAPSMAEMAAALRLLAGAYVRESLVTATDERLYVLIPRRRSTGLATWVGGMLDRLTARFGTQLRAAIAAPVVEPRPGSGRPHRGRPRPGPPDGNRAGDVADPVENSGAARRDRRPRPVPRGAQRPSVAGPGRLRPGAPRRPWSITLERYLQRFGDVRAAADDLHIHPNTLRYRIRRAEEILGMSLEDPDSRLLLQIQLLIWPSRSRPVGR